MEKVYRDRAERSLQRQSRRLLGCHPTAVHQDGIRHQGGLDGLLDDAQGRGLISEQEIHEVWPIHTITSGENPEDGSKKYAAMDLAVTVQEQHVNTLAARAEILRRATGRPVAAALRGAFISNEFLRHLAGEKKVKLLSLNLDMAKMYRYVPKDLLREAYSGKVKMDPAQKEIYE